jgi:peptidoglycan/LPS O-acetylase OafA/YrhL
MAVGYKLSATPGAVAVWLLAQLTVGQSYNPAFLRGFGVGALNGSLWTIGVEVQFYVLAPLLLTLLTKLRIAKQWAIAALVVGLALVNEMFGYLKATSSPGFAVKVTGITVLPFLVYFVLGATVYVTGAEKRFGTRRVFWSALACHLVIAYVAWRAGMRFGGNYLHVISGMTLAAVALSFAFLPERTWSRILEGRDYSYSLYLYHMPIINALLFLGLSGASAAVACAVAVSIASVLSWHLVEKPAIRAGRAGNWTDRILPAPSVQGS